MTQTQLGCPAANSTATLCYEVYNASSDTEWLTDVELAFPAGWTVACKSQDEAESGGNTINFTCNPAGNLLSYDDNDGSYGEIYGLCTWGFCVDVTAPSSNPHPATMNWNLVGDAYGDPPHFISGSDPFCSSNAITLTDIGAENSAALLIAAAALLLVLVSGGAVLAFKRYRA